MEESKAQPALVTSIEQVEVALERIQTSKKSWTSNLIMLAISLFLFVSAGLFKATFSGVMIIVLVLFIHELGHWIGMKIFRYRDVQMFFIPFFGAAVSGSETNPSGAKRAIVSLLGPLPGIVIGVICGALYLFSGTLFTESGVAIFQPPKEIYAELAQTFFSSTFLILLSQIKNRLVARRGGIILGYEIQPNHHIPRFFSLNQEHHKS